MSTSHTVGVSRADSVDPTDKAEKKRLQTWNDLLQHTKIDEIINVGKAPALVSAADDETVDVAFKKLIDHNLLSMPVFCKSRGRYTDFVDVLDILVHVLNSFPRDKLTPDADFSQYMKEPVSALSDLSARNPYEAVEITAPFIVALKKMTHKGLHRIPIVDGAGHLEFIMTQSAIMSFISKNLDLFPGASKTVGELNLGYKAQVVAARRTQASGLQPARLPELQVRHLHSGAGLHLPRCLDHHRWWFL
eukprot:TRINITY_DN7007_c0_g1_i2.p1 TRINITY_DN7007_c0_g1~~TRINITY_DN7007_c0_g1_i2.p1  ORF type:complete len:259 (-),score=53.19 TRINITY_DN7007_c0_g1_i2:9-752(-)